MWESSATWSAYCGRQKGPSQIVRYPKDVKICLND
jgi:hypothetical protein